MKVLALVLLAFGAQEEETVALTNLRILTVTKGEISSGTIIIKGGKIAAIGADAKAPAGARVVDGKGLVAFPGLVHPYSRLGFADGPTGAVGSTPQNLAADEINPSLDVFMLAARTGVTTFLLQPTGLGIAGQSAVVKPGAWTRDELVIDKSAALRIVMPPGTAGKEALKQALEGARKALEAEKKSASAKPDERIAPLVKFLKGELPAIVELYGPAEVLHFWQVMEPFAEFKTRVVFAGSPDFHKAAAELGARKARVILRPMITLAPFTRERINTAAELDRAGAQVALTPLSDTPDGLQGTLFRVAELVKYGLPREAALRAVTIVPAEIVGLEKRIGSLEGGKDADLILFTGDPLSPESRLHEIYINGKPVFHGE